MEITGLDKFITRMKEKKMAKKGTVNIRGKEYQTVALRIHNFREQYPIDKGWGVTTQVLQCDSEGVLVRAEIHDPDGRCVGCGHGQETWTGNINSTSAVENGETSAIGRALASCGLGGESYCTAEEVTNAIAQQQAGHTNRPAPRKAAPPVQAAVAPAEEAAPVAEPLAIPATSVEWAADGWSSYFETITDGESLVSTLDSIRAGDVYKGEVARYVEILKAASARGRKIIDKRTTVWKKFTGILNEEKSYVDSVSA